MGACEGAPASRRAGQPLVPACATGSQMNTGMPGWRSWCRSVAQEDDLIGHCQVEGGRPNLINLMPNMPGS